MRYAIVFATLAASALATPYINVEVSEPGEVAVDKSRHSHHNNRQHKGLRRHDRNDRNEREEDDPEFHSNGWFSSFWRKNRDNDRRGGRDRDRRGHNGRRDRDRDGDYDDDDDNQNLAVNNLIDDLFGSDYECIIQGTSQQKERKDAKECCREVGGELYDVPGRCVFRDVYENPREDWRTCAMEQSGAVFADCYYREQREVDDELSSRRRSSQSRSRSRDSKSRHQRNRHQNRRNRNHHGRNDREDRDDRRDNDQVFLARSDEDNSGHSRHGRMQLECKLNLNDENREREITRQCCNERYVDGQLTRDEQRCEVRRDQNAFEFEDCAEEKGVQEDQMECYELDHREEF